MAELTRNAISPDCIFGKAGSNKGKSDGTMSAGTIPLNPLIYVKYKDHAIYKNIQHPVAEAVERETVGWLTKQNEEILLVEHDRTVSNAQLPSGQGNGIIILKSCILEIRLLPLQKISNWHLNSQKTKVKLSMRFSQRSEKLSPKSKGKDEQQCKR
jgi:hypothetical protein